MASGWHWKSEMSNLKILESYSSHNLLIMSTWLTKIHRYMNWAKVFYKGMNLSNLLLSWLVRFRPLVRPQIFNLQLITN